MVALVLADKTDDIEIIKEITAFVKEFIYIGGRLKFKDKSIGTAEVYILKKGIYMNYACSDTH